MGIQPQWLSADKLCEFGDYQCTFFLCGFGHLLIHSSHRPVHNVSVLGGRLMCFDFKSSLAHVPRLEDGCPMQGAVARHVSRTNFP